MLRWVLICVLAGAGFWYLSEHQSSEDESAGVYDIEMRQCTAKKRSAASHTATSAVHAEKECAEELGVYRQSGHWYSYDEVRP